MSPSIIIVPQPIFIPSGQGGGDIPWQAGLILMVVFYLVLGVMAVGADRMERDVDGDGGLFCLRTFAWLLGWPIVLPYLTVRWLWRNR